MKTLAEVFDAATVARLSGPFVYPRGVSYASDGRVEQAEVRDARMGATVRGTMPGPLGGRAPTSLSGAAASTGRFGRPRAGAS